MATSSLPDNENGLDTQLTQQNCLHCSQWAAGQEQESRKRCCRGGHDHDQQKTHEQAKNTLQSSCRFELSNYKHTSCKKIQALIEFCSRPRLAVDTRRNSLLMNLLTFWAFAQSPRQNNILYSTAKMQQK